ncbi:MAG: Asp23/Gls24 family envelope stress response protein [Eggerthellaceae bacterium]|nr:Asp23/Gls24 family envelope stress response protein [Eggerthellaceae bacterium]
MTDLNLEGMALAPGVVETIIFFAANEVEGVAQVGTTGGGGLRSMFSAKNVTQGIEIEVTEDDKLYIAIRIEVIYGYTLPEVAANIRSSVADAVISQIGIPVSRVDIFIDGIRFEN